jgi:hypothetical protein
MLDIGKCLNEAISKLEHAQESSMDADDEAVKQMANLQGVCRTVAAALQVLLGPQMNQAFGDKSSLTLRTVISGNPMKMVHPDTSVQETAEKWQQCARVHLS